MSYLEGVKAVKGDVERSFVVVRETEHSTTDHTRTNELVVSFLS